MEKVSVKQMIKFRSLPSAKRRETFIKNLIKQNEEDNEEDKRDYWIFCLSTIGSACRHDKLQLITDKIEDLNQRKRKNKHDNAKLMYQRNIDALSNFEEYEFSDIKPGNIMFHSRPRSSKIIIVNKLAVKVLPSYVFEFNNRGKKEIGAIWFVADVKRFRNDELGIFLELLYRYLVATFGKSHTINKNYCRVVEVGSGREVKYSDINSAEISATIEKTVEEIKTTIKKTKDN